MLEEADGSVTGSARRWPRRYRSGDGLAGDEDVEGEEGAGGIVSVMGGKERSTVDKGRWPRSCFTRREGRAESSCERVEGVEEVKEAVELVDTEPAA